MKIHFYSEATLAGHPGREISELDLELEDLPPMAARVLRKDGLDALLTDWYRWTAIGIDIWWCARPLGVMCGEACAA